MSTIELTVLPDRTPASGKAPTIALAGNPNAGKTTIFNALTGLRAKTANFPGTTIERRHGMVRVEEREIRLLDLPGLYGLTGCTDEERVARDALMGAIPGETKPMGVVIVVDSTNLERNLYLASQVLETKVPAVVALTMTDIADRDRLMIDTAKLSKELNCQVIRVNARSGRGIEELRHAITSIVDGQTAVPASSCGASACSGCPFQARYDWAEDVGDKCITSRGRASGERTAKIDRILTHPVGGVVVFLGIMFTVFSMIFWIAQYPMGWIDSLFNHAKDFASSILPQGDLQSLIANGIIGGVGGVLIFLPQICILFFFLALLEDTGYLARAAFVMDRLMRRVGLPGKAFVPMIAAHACAVPAIMATRVIEDKRDRLVSIMVLPLLTCSARIPVYAMVVALLFGDQPLKAAGLFTGAYMLGIIAALFIAFLFKRTILPGESRPLVLELPAYKLPTLRSALYHTFDRAIIFVKKAGTVILLISIVLWAAATYPKSDTPADVVAMRQTAEQTQNKDLGIHADRLEAQNSLAHSFAGRLGHFIEPAIRPLGFDWQIGVGVISSFAAREVIVSTLAIVYGVGEDAAEDNPDSLYETMNKATRSDGTPVFTTATCISLLVFYVLAMQCLPTQAVTKRETGSWKWAGFQLAYMTVLAYGAALIAYQTISALS